MKILFLFAHSVLTRHSRSTRHPGEGRALCGHWRKIPACAGMTAGVVQAAMIAILAFVLLPPFTPAYAEPERFLDIKTITTPGGIEVWLVEDHSVPVIAMQFAFAGAGSALDPEDKQGLAQLLSNTMDEGAGDLDSQTFQKKLADYSIDLHYSAGRDDFFGSLRTLTQYEDKAFDLLRLSLTAPRFDAEPVQRMKDANISRIRSSLSDPDWM